ncbi:MAG: hypothetical protein EBT45_04735 [Alphaproteobacteria bacterium]|nr:hypothetical protein [Alphaproteobacteria bacterium]
MPIAGYIGVSLNKKDAKQNSNFGKLGNWVNVWYVIFVFLDVYRSYFQKQENLKAFYVYASFANLG